MNALVLGTLGTLGTLATPSRVQNFKFPTIFSSHYLHLMTLQQNAFELITSNLGKHKTR